MLFVDLAATVAQVVDGVVHVEVVQAVTCVAPVGELGTRDVPATAAGPSLRELLVGSEGALEVITAATLRVRPLPQTRHYEAWSFRSFEEGVQAHRILEQAGASPDVARLSDEHETRLSKALASKGAPPARTETGASVARESLLGALPT